MNFYRRRRESERRERGRKIALKKVFSCLSLSLFIAVVLNRNAAEPLSALKSSRGTANFWTWRLFIFVVRGATKLFYNEVPWIKKGWETLLHRDQNERLLFAWSSNITNKNKVSSVLFRNFNHFQWHSFRFSSSNNVHRVLAN